MYLGVAMLLLRHLAVLFAFLAAFVRPAPASVFTPASPETRVGGFEIASQLLVGELGAASREQHQELGAAYDENASGYRFAAGGGGRTTYEILDGVRRSKAAEIAGRTGIEAEIEVAGRTVGRETIPLDALRSPKEAISTGGSGLQRWLNTLRQTLSGSKPPPIRVTPGTRGTPIPDVRIE